VDKVALGQVSLRVLQLSPVSIIALYLSTLVYHRRDKQNAHWWPQFRDIVSLHSKEQEDQHLGLKWKVTTLLQDLRNKELHNFYSSTNIVQMIKS
jgi:hypothetical protein